MPLNLDLRLDERQSDRVMVSVRLEPDDDCRTVDGVALQLCDASGDDLGPRLLLPISGQLSGPTLTRAELRSLRPIPEGSQVVATAWWGQEQIEVSCPSARGTCLEFHMRGRTRVALPSNTEVRPLSRGERAVLVQVMPWIAEIRPQPQRGAIEDVEPEDTAEGFVEEYGLDEENAQWLEELLAEPDL